MLIRIKRIAPRTASDEVRMVSQILWKQAERGEKRAKSEELCRVEELCDHLNDMSFEDVNKDRFYFVTETFNYFIKNFIICSI